MQLWLACIYIPFGVYRGIACIWAHWLLKLICEQVPTVCWALLGIRGHRKDDKERAFALGKPVLAFHGELQVSDLNRSESHGGERVRGSPDQAGVAVPTSWLQLGCQSHPPSLLLSLLSVFRNEQDLVRFGSLVGINDNCPPSIKNRV